MRIVSLYTGLLLLLLVAVCATTTTTAARYGLDARLGACRNATFMSRELPYSVACKADFEALDAYMHTLNCTRWFGQDQVGWYGDNRIRAGVNCFSNSVGPRLGQNYDGTAPITRFNSGPSITSSMSAATLTFDAEGDPDAEFVVGLSTISGNRGLYGDVRMFLANGAQAKNIFWHVGVQYAGITPDDPYNTGQSALQFRKTAATMHAYGTFVVRSGSPDHEFAIMAGTELIRITGRILSTDMLNVPVPANVFSFYPFSAPYSDARGRIRATGPVQIDGASAGCTLTGCAHGGICRGTDETGAALMDMQTQCVNCANGWSGVTCNTTNPLAVVRSTAMLQVGNATYGPGICGVTLDCAVSATTGVVTGVNGVAGVDYPCNLVDRFATVVAGKCVCSDACMGGYMCTTRLANIPVSVLVGWQAGSSYRTVSCSDTSLWSVVTVTNPTTHTMTQGTLQQWAAVQYRPPNGYVSYPPTGTLASNGCLQSCNATDQVCVIQTFTGSSVVEVNGALHTAPASAICCPRGYSGNRCEIAVGCSVGGCDHGGQCLLTTVQGAALPLGDTRCFGCSPGVNGTQGWGGTFCHVRNTPTFVLVQSSTPASRRLLANTTTLVRASDARNSLLSGAIYKEPSRACDCAVSWTAIAPDQDTSRPVLLMGNYTSNNGAGVLLSTVRYGTVASGNPTLPVYFRHIRNHTEARYQCSGDVGCGGYYYAPVAANANGFIGVVAYWQADPALLASDSGFLTGRSNYNTQAVGLGATGFPPATTSGFVRYSIRRVEPNGLCADPTLDIIYYCTTYASQCKAIQDAGGVGNVRIPAGSGIGVLAGLHYSAFGHKVRNSPNAGCVLTSMWAEDETGCVNQIAVPKINYPVAVNATVTAEVCGDVSRINSTRIYGGLPLLPGSTGTNVSDSGVSHCSCYPPFRANDVAHLTDCAYDLCGKYGKGRVDGRGLIDSAYVNDHANKTAVPEDCMCLGIWGTDPSTCNGATCDWCAATLCENLGTVTGSDYNAACSCPPIFTGDRCETSLCNATNTLPVFNLSKWEGHDRATIVCDCAPGWTGQLCNDLECVHGTWDYGTGACACTEGYSGAQCEVAYCTETRGIWKGNNTCECFAPWSGLTCDDHSCNTNIMEGTAGWAGVTPYGAPRHSATGSGPTLWECGCNFPYQSTAYQTGGRPLDCHEHACHHGLPNANASNVKHATDACTCSDPHDIGIFTDPVSCTGMTAEQCPNSCMSATCTVNQTVHDLVGGWPGVTNDKCCNCQVSLAFHVVAGTCLEFCAFTPQCLTTNTSHYHMETTFTAVNGTNTTTNATYSYVQEGLEWVCECDAYYYATHPLELYDCNGKIFPVRESVQNQSNSHNGAGPNYQNPTGETPTADSSSSSSPVTTTQVIAISAAGAAALLFILAQWSQYVTNKAISKGIDVVVDKAVTTTRGRASIAGEQARLINGVVMIIGIIVSLAMPVVGAPFLYPSNLMWSDTSSLQCTSNGDVYNGVSFEFLGFTNGVKWSGGSTRNGYYTYVDLFPIAVFLQSGINGPSLPQPDFLIESEFVYAFYDYTPGTMVRIGDATLPLSSLTWSALRTYGNGNGANKPYYFALNICVAGRTTCSSHGTCVSMPAFASSAGGGFSHCPGEYTEAVKYVWQPNDSGDSTTSEVVIYKTGYSVRGCKCENGWSGVYCETKCSVLPGPGTTGEYSDLCSGNGTCASNDAVTDDQMRTCMCRGGCKCNYGYEGDRCERAVQTRGPFYPDLKPTHPEFMALNSTEKANVLTYNVTMTDFSNCCPYGSTDCSPMSVPSGFLAPATRLSTFGYASALIPYTYTATCTPVLPCATGSTCGCRAPDANPSIGSSDWATVATRQYAYSDLLSTHLMPPNVCGEDYAITDASWSSKFDASSSGQTNGKGKCWLGLGIEQSTGVLQSNTKSYCVCNNPTIYHPINRNASGLPDIVNAQRHGWFGPNCQYRTCTRRIGVPVPDANGYASHPDFINTTRTMKQMTIVASTMSAPSSGVPSSSYPASMCTDGSLSTVCSTPISSASLPWMSFSLASTAPIDHISLRVYSCAFGAYNDCARALASFVLVLGSPGEQAIASVYYGGSGDWSTLAGYVGMNGIPDRSNASLPNGKRVNFTVDAASASAITIIGTDPGYPLTLLEFEIWSYVEGNGIQCSGHVNGKWAGNSNNYDDESTPCDDKIKTALNGSIINVNTWGVCRGCDEGWGLYAGYRATDLIGTGYDHTDVGICSERTMHSSGGGACGGYGQVTASNVRVQGYNGGAPATVSRVTACGCTGPNGEDWGLTRYKNADGIDSGLCQRTCAHGAALVVLPDDATTGNGYYTAREANRTFYSETFGNTQCGGYQQGLCRPIVHGSRPDGFNSACMCAIGYGGPECKKIDSMWHAPKGYTPRPCGLHGLGVLRSHSDWSTSDFLKFSPGGYTDEWWFNSQIVPLNRAAITNPDNAALYSAQVCQCQEDKARDGWLPDDNGICAPSCNAIELMGVNTTSGLNTTLCSAHGSCVDNQLGVPGKACQCDLGWGGANCGTEILRDRQHAMCGGLDRGSISYTDESKLYQHCVCNLPYVVNSNSTSSVGDYSGLCWRDCPVNPVTGLQCSGPQQGSCSIDTVADGLNGRNTGNDNVCTCTKDAFTGADCAQQLVAAYVTASGKSLPCSSHGTPDPAANGFCVCLDGWVGAACQVFRGNRDCGHGQCVQDDEALGIVIQ